MPAPLRLGFPAHAPARASLRLLLLAESGVRVSDPSLVTHIYVGIRRKGAEADMAGTAVVVTRRAGRFVDLCAWELLLPLRLSQTSAALSAPARSTPATFLLTWGVLSTAGWRSLRALVTAATRLRGIYVSCTATTLAQAADPYLLEIGAVVPSGVP